MHYYRGSSSMSDCSLSICFANLFRFALPLAKKKYILLVAIDFAPSKLHDWGFGKDFKQNLLTKSQVRCTVPPQATELTTERKRLKKEREMPNRSSVSNKAGSVKYHSCQRRKRNRKQKFLDRKIVSFPRNCIFTT